jgi:hypothetical protein
MYLQKKPPAPGLGIFVRVLPLRNFIFKKVRKGSK